MSIITDLENLGAVRLPKLVSADALQDIAGLFASEGPGKRLSSSDLAPLGSLVWHDGSLGRVAAKFLGKGAQPVRALLLEKSPTNNWRLGWHQDRTIAVAERRDTAGFGPWTRKAGTWHVQPPHSVTEGMVTLRIHVDPVDQSNAPLRVLTGSHKLGRLSESAIEALVEVSEPMVCLAAAGDVWAYRSAIVHASQEQTGTGPRRVLQIDYSADDLPGCLEWALQRLS